jgi:hypothetical protein
LAQNEAKRVEGSRREDDLYKAIYKQVIEETGVVGRWSNEAATAEFGLSDRAYEKETETLEIVLPGLREKLGRGDASSMAFEVDCFLEIHGIKLDVSSASYRRLCYEFLRTAVKCNS